MMVTCATPRAHCEKDCTNMAPVRRFLPSQEDWVEYWPTIIEMFEHGNNDGGRLTVVALAQRMKAEIGFTASVKMYRTRMTNAGIKINLVASERAKLAQELLTDYRNGQPLSNTNIYELRKVIRYHPKDTPEALHDLEVLKLIEASLVRPSGSDNAADYPAEASGNEDDALSREDAFSWELSSYGTIPPHEHDHVPIASAGLPDVSTWMQSFPQRPSGVRDPSFKSGPPRPRDQLPRVLDPTSRHDFGPDLEKLISRTQMYYIAKIKTADKETTVTEQTQFQDFWTRFKDVIWLHKDGGSDRANPLLMELMGLIPRICMMQNLSLLRELFGTLSQANTDIFPGLRDMMLRQFAKHLSHLDNELAAICNTLLQDWVRDRHMVILLKRLIRLTKDNADATHPELPKLYRATVALLRRMHNFPDAYECVIDARELIEQVHGSNSELTRLILSEQAYLFKARGQLKEALELTEDIVRRAQLDEGTAYPSRRARYHLEDVADIQKKLKKHREAVKAMEAALHNTDGKGPHEEAALHLEDKLDEIQKEMHNMHISVDSRQQPRP